MTSSPSVGRLRGKTRPGRLHLWDALCQAVFVDSCARGVVEVGIGERAYTTRELLQWAPGPVVALEVHPRRAALAAEALSDAPVTVLEADALVPSETGGRGGLLRCANVLRQYPVDAVGRAHAALSTWVDDEGVVLEGSCDKVGHVGALHVLRKCDGTLQRAGLAFLTDFRRGFAPIQLRDHLPRDLRRQVRAGGCMADFFFRWTRCWQDTRTGSPQVDFKAAGDAMGDDVEVVFLDAWSPGGMALLWRPAGGVPLPQ